MLSPSRLKHYGLDTDSLKALFAPEPVEKKPGKKAAAESKPDSAAEKRKKFVELTRDRIKDGRVRALKNYRHWAAVDLAYDAPFYQETPTLIRHVMSTCSTADDVMKAVKQWGLCESDLFCKTKNAAGKEVYELNAPVFFETLVPIVRAYVSVRVAKIFNDRNILPLFKYEPLKYTAENRVRCEIVTDIVQAMTAQFNYAATLRQLIFQTLLYSVCLQFPLEPWYTESGEDANGTKIVEKEGVRYVTPHVTRLIYDTQHPLSSFNTDSGCSFAGYWTIYRYGDIADNDKYWNTEKISYGFNWLDKNAPYANYFEQAYPCTLELPKVADASKETDRETIANRYSTTDYDKAVFVTPLFQRIIPKDCGIGTYDGYVWMRTIVAGDDTFMHMEAFSYNPVTYSGYDADQGRGLNASLALELVPYQDHFANLVTQMLLTIKRNLTNVTFYDTNIVNTEQIDALRIHTNWQYRNQNFIGFDSFKGRVAGNDPRSAFHEMKFQYADISQMMQAFTMMMSIVERLLGFSAQELGGQATHQQSKAEVVLIAGNTSTRVSYTASFIDEAVDAWKKQIYDAIIAHMDREIVAQVSTDIPDLQKHLTALGFKGDGDLQTQRKLVVKGKKEKLALESFASTRDGPDRGNDRETAQAILLAIQALSSNQRLSAIVDPVSVLELLERAAKLTGADRDFKIRTNPDALKSQMLVEAIQKISELVKQQVVTEVAKPAAAALAEQEHRNDEQDAQMTELTKQLMALQKMFEQAMQAPPLQPPTMLDAPPMPPVLPPIPPNAIEPPPIAIAPAAPIPGMA